jgi:hypothetical protein
MEEGNGGHFGISVCVEWKDFSWQVAILPALRLSNFIDCTMHVGMGEAKSSGKAPAETILLGTSIHDFELVCGNLPIQQQRFLRIWLGPTCGWSQPINITDLDFGVQASRVVFLSVFFVVNLDCPGPCLIPTEQANS